MCEECCRGEVMEDMGDKDFWYYFELTYTGRWGNA